MKKIKKSKKRGIKKLYEVLDQDFRIISIKFEKKTISIEMEEK